MKKKKPEKVQYTSYEDYLKRFYPSTGEPLAANIDDPRAFGVELARESLEKLKQALMNG